MSLLMVGLLVCGVMAFLAAVLIVSAVVAGGRARRFEEPEQWPADEEEG
jgi:hypothetical protein